MRRSILLLLVTIGLTFTGCQKENNYVVGVDKLIINATFYDNSYSVCVTSDYDWEAVSNNEWITLTKDVGTAGASQLDITVAQNPNIEGRKGSIEFRAKGSNISKSLTVSQAANDFTFSVENVTATTADLSVTAKSESKTFYWYNVTDEDFTAYYERNTITLMNSIRDMLRSYIQMGAFPSWSSLLSRGFDSQSVKGLKPDTEYMMFAFGIDNSGNITSKEASYIWYRTLPKE